MTKSGNTNAKSHGAYAQIIPPLAKNPKFVKLHDRLINHFLPKGVLQKAIIRDLAKIWWQKRKFDRWHAREFSALLNNSNAEQRLQSDLHELDDLDRQVEELECAFNERAAKLGKSVISAKGKHAERLRGEIAELEQARNGALAPLHQSRERQRLAREDSPDLRKFERLERARAALEAKLDRCLRRFAQAQVFDQIQTSQMLKHHPAKLTIDATAERTKAKAIVDSGTDGRDDDDDDERERGDEQQTAKMLKDEHPAIRLGPYRKKKSKDADEGEDW